jgi:hypothetical protein
LDLQIFIFSTFLDPILKPPNRILQFPKLDGLVFLALPNLVINTCPPAF